ncbi:MAG: flagellar hook-length control protein FliK [Lachnospiraceae bacterium]|nr:flagellar hook-length control protein FliK [Lachnospiraceae bacterium]
MAFQLSDLFSYQTNKENYGQTTTVKGNDSANAMEEKEHILSQKELSAFSKGSSVTGQVISVEGDAVKLRLADDTYVNARLEQRMHVLPGQKLTFEVKSNSGSTLSLTPLFTNLNTGTNVIKGLEAANIPISDASVGMITAMMDKGMSIDIGSLQNMYRQVMSYPKGNPADIVEMKQLSIPVSEENLMQFQAYKNYEHQILSGIQEIADSLEQTCLELAAAGDVQGAAAIYKELTAMLSEGEALWNEGNVAENASLAETTVLEENSQAQSLPKDSIPEEILVKGQQLPIKEGEILAEGTVEAVRSQEGEKPPVIVFKEDMPPVSQENELASPNNTGEKEGELSGLLNGKERAALSENLTALGVSKEIAQTIKEGTISYKQLFSLLSKVSEAKGQSKPLQKLYASREFGMLIKDRMMKQFLMEPETVGKEGKVSEYYEKLQEQTRRLTDTLSTIGKENSSLFKSVDTLRQNMDFMNQLNQVFNYVQLPLKFSQGSAHGDLYVYTNKKNLAKDNGSISALLHLDMENLGPVDVYVTMTGSEKVSTKFYLRDDDMLSFIESNIHILNERLEKRGYLLKTEVTVKSREEKGFGELLTGGEEAEKHMLLSTQAFDVRA